MDSNPLVALPMGSVARILPANFQFIGLWILVCLVLHAGFSYALICRSAPNMIATLAGLLLLILVPALFQSLAHDTLLAQWTILAAYLIYFSPSRRRKDCLWFILLCTTALIHVYLLLMVGILWVCDGARAVWLRRRATVREQLLPLAWFLAGIGAAAFFLWAGGTMAPNTQLSAPGWGQYAMRLDGPLNPTIPDTSLFLPAWSPPPGNWRAIPFEGFQYLGLGVIALILVAYLLLASKIAKIDEEFLIKLIWLFPGILLLTALAVTNDVSYLGVHILIPLPEKILDILGMVRASGRFFWPVTYLAILVALQVIFSVPRRRSTVILCACAALQIADIFPLAARLRQTTVSAASPFARTPSPLWSQMIAEAGIIEFEPSKVEGNEPLFYEIAWRAASLHRPVTTAYVARDNIDQLARRERMRSEFLAGHLDPRRMYVILPPFRFPEAMGRRRVVYVDGVAVLPAVREQPIS